MTDKNNFMRMYVFLNMYLSKGFKLEMSIIALLNTCYFEVNIVHTIFILIVHIYEYLLNQAFHVFLALLI